MSSIDREDTIKILKDLQKDHLQFCLIPFRQAIERVQALPSADRPQEWIPCSERMPSNFSEDETVLATTDVDGDRVIPMFAFDVKSFYLKGYISAWMPLPKPWKGADDE